jgi:hypothetical protein
VERHIVPAEEHRTVAEEEVLRIDLAAALHTDSAAVAHRTGLVEVVHRTALGEEERCIGPEKAHHTGPGVLGHTVQVEERHIDLVVGVHHIGPEVVVLHNVLEAEERRTVFEVEERRTVLEVEERRTVLEVEERRTDLVVVRHTDPEAAGRSLVVVDSPGSALEVADYSLAVEVVRILVVGEL